VAFAVPASTEVAFAAAGFAGVDFTEIGFTMATSTTGFSSLTALETRFLTIHIHIPTATIPTAIIRTVIILMVTDTVAFVEMAFAMATFTAVVFTVVALTVMARTAVALTEVDDSYNEPVYQGSVGWTGMYSRCRFNQISSLVHGSRFADDCHLRSCGFLG